MTCASLPTGSTILAPAGTVSVCIGQYKAFKIVIDDSCGDLVPLAGVKLVLCVKKCVDDEFPVFVLSTDDPNQILVTGVGEAQVFFLPEVTKLLEAGDYTYTAWGIFPVDLPVPLIVNATFNAKKCGCTPVV